MTTAHLNRPARKHGTQTPNRKQQLWSAGRAASLLDDDKTKGPRLSTPTNGPGFTPAKPIGEMPKAQERITTASMRQIYEGKELKVNPGIPDERLAAFSLPSRMGNRYRAKVNGQWVDA